MIMRALIGCAAVALLLGCGRNGVFESQGPNLVGPTGMTSPAAVTPGGAIQTAAVRDVNVVMQDACDPDTFNAALGAGTCVRSGGVTFENFIALLTKQGSVGSWFFAPRVANARSGDAFVVANHGGEVHTFTEVEEFGGGIVPSLNILAHVPDQAPECLALEQDDFVAPGETYTEDIEETGHEKYQCCIHPWMRLEADIAAAVHMH